MFVFAASAFIVGAVLYSAWVTGQFTTPEVDRTDGFVSELAAGDQPWTRLFRVSGGFSGLACLAGVALAPRTRRGWQGWLALAGFAVLTVAQSLFPLDCAALSDPVCGFGELSPAHYLHLAASTLATTVVLAAMVLLSLRWRARVAWGITGLTLAVTPAVPVAAAAGHLAGLADRAQVTLVAIWLVYVALRLLLLDDPVRTGRPHVREQGSGPAVIIISGLAGAWSPWDRVADGLARSHRVVRFDRPGMGLSPPPPEPSTLYDEAARLAALAPAHPEQVTVVAHAMAAWHAEAFARLHPLRVSRLVLVEPACADRRGSATSRRAIVAWLPALGGTWGAAALARVAGPAAYRLLTGAPDREGAFRRGRVLAGVAGEWLACRDMAADLRRIRAAHAFPDVPVTVISAGRRSHCHERLASELDAKYIRLPDCGHHVQLDDPDSIIAAVI
ncbi:alpha/beta fold hydrolase [Nonomuraea sp. NPDC000554]|uniref:alpha/beta fold hydrolase n=1 Tax=Nonomuraea sp. NPDC000554 TaxID=3154259 RepID=UPI00332C96FB